MSRTAVLAVWLVSVLATNAHNINVFLIPHSHDDTGWQRTVDQYHWEQVRHTYTSVVKALQDHPDRRFIFVEMAFMSRWWDEQDAATKASVKSMVKSGQIEIVNGGHCMADDANPDLRGIIDQITVGHQWAKQELDTTVKVGWHIDPFGLPSAIPQLFSSLGYDMFVGNRISYDLKDAWKTSKHLEFTWAPASAIVTGPGGEDPSPPSIFTHILDSHYSAVTGFDWEYFSGLGGDDLANAVPNPAVVSAAASAFDDVNVKQRAEAYVTAVRQRAEWFRHSNLLVPFGDDFKWQNAPIQYGNMDQVIAYINGHPEFNVTIRYSTVSEYYTAVQHESASKSVSFPTYHGDFVPYESSFGAYWTGYFVSRPLLKGMIRHAEGYMHSAEVACAVGFSSGESDCSQTQLNVPRRAVAVSHHHDAITGTSLPPVVLDFQTRSSGAAELSAARLKSVVSSLKGTETHTDTPSAADRLSSGAAVTVTVWNSLGWARTEAVTLEPVSVSSVTVVGPDGSTVPSQVNELSSKKGTHRVVFLASVPPMGFATYTVTPQAATATTGESASSVHPSGAPPTLSNEYLKLSFNASTGFTSSLQDLTSTSASPAISFGTDFALYDESGTSNPYVFTPFFDEFTAGAEAKTVSATTGAVMSEVNQTVSLGLAVSWRVYHGTQSPYAEAVFTVTPLTKDRAYVVRVNTSLDNTDSSLDSSPPVFYTDTNGLQVQRRVKNLMPWTLQDPSMLSNITDGISANFYPSPTAAFIYDPKTDTQLTVMGDRARSASSQHKGDLRVMVHRRCAETQHIPLDDSTTISTVNWFAVGNATQSSMLHRSLVIRNANPVVPLWDNTAENTAASLRGMAPFIASLGTKAKATGTFSALSASLPPNVHLMSLQALSVSGSATQAILRLHHMYAIGEHPTLSSAATVDLSTLFDVSVLKVTAISETNLSGVSVLASSPVSMQHPQVTLTALSLRTFVVTLTPPSA